ncbi:wnt inhibitory factor 1-like, partial [Oxyura jamaicensis]|uniref:wnt inhibitory factor 1-like n=1 Tax=Oxyura jamaicensis TaxID=8884 RepID=UPI0015A6F2D5
MAPAGRLCAALLCGALSLCSLRAAGRQPDTLYLWIEAQQARVLIGFEEDILIVSEGKMAPFTHDFRKAQQRMPAIPVNIHAMNFTWQATGRVGAEPGRGAGQVLHLPLGKPLRGAPLRPIAPHCSPSRAADRQPQ